MQAALLKARLLERVAQAESEYASGRYIDGEDFIDSLKEKYGL